MTSFPPRLMDHVLPANATWYERALASMGDRLLALDTQRIRNLWNPWKCHIDDLPYLAWGLSVDLWDPSWSETKKRSVVAASLQLHALKGTEEGIRRHIALADAKLLRTIAPPARGFYTPALTDEGRKRWLNDLPQVRIYPFVTRRTAPRKRAFYRGPRARPPSTTGRSGPTPSSRSRTAGCSRGARPPSSIAARRCRRSTRCCRTISTASPSGFGSSA